MSPRFPRCTVLPALVVALALSAAPAPAAFHHRAPVLVTVHCSSSCTGVHKVSTGGALRVRGHNIVRGLTVVFPSRSGRGPAVRAPLRMSRAGLVVTVPTSAGTGLVHVKDAAGHRSNAIGPITVIHPVVVKPPPAPLDGTPAGPTPLDDNGMWIWQLPKSSGGDVQAIIDQARAYGIGTVFIKSSDGPDNYWKQFTPDLIATLHAAGLQVCAWQYVYGSKPAGEAALGVRAVQDGADCLVIDAESEYEGRYSAAQTYVTDLRIGVGPDYPIALAGFPYVDFHPAFPYSVFLGPGGAQYNAPQMYWKDIGTTVDNVFAHTYLGNRIYQRPIYPLGQTYQSPPAADIVRFRELAQAYGATGVSWWDWQETPSAQWTAIAAPLDQLTDFVPSTALPDLIKGSKGDEVVWMQEHLAAFDPTIKVDGEIGKATVASLKAFQLSLALPATGATDPATWQGLLALTPTVPAWNASASGGATAARARTHSTAGRRLTAPPKSATLPAVRDEIPQFSGG